VIQQLINGLGVGSTYALIATGFVLIFGVAKVFNAAQGGIAVLGLYVGATVADATGGNFLIAIVAALAVGVVSGVGVEFVAVRPLARRGGLLAPFLTTLGLGELITGVLVVIYGTEPRNFTVGFARGAIHVGSVDISERKIWIVGIALVLVVALHRLIYGTRWGRECRAVAEDPARAEILGINPARLRILVLMLGCGIAGLTGGLLGFEFSSGTLTEGLNLTVQGLLIAVIAGFTSFAGAATAGLLLGVAETFIAAYVPTIPQNAVAYIVVVLVLLVRPTGLVRAAAVEEMRL